jgi:Uma2 family endonuclease
MVVQEKSITLEELKALPNDGIKREVVNGVLIEMSPPNAIHGLLAIALGYFLFQYNQKNKLGKVTAETGYVLSKVPLIVRSPYVAFISQARLEKPDLNDYIPMCPDLAVEIVSPNDTATEVKDKIALYFQAGTRLIWVVYPNGKEIHVYDGNRANLSIVDINGILDGGTVLPGFSLSMRDLFEDLES